MPNPLPNTPVCKLYREIQGELLFMNSPDPLFMALGTVAANMLEGDPAWVMVIGPSGCGKSELLKALKGIGGVYFKSSITGEQALLSGMPGKRGTGGILRQVGNHGLLIFDDFTRMLKLHPLNRDAILSAFRDVHSGNYSRDLGVDGGRSISWPADQIRGRVGMLAGCTPAIDKYHEISNELGERWIYYRFPDDTAKHERARFSIRNSQRREDWRADLRNLIATFFVREGLAFGHPIIPYREAEEVEMKRLVEMASFGCLCRSVVSRHWKTTAIESVETESPNRMATTLRQLFMGMDQISVPLDVCWRITGTLALDSMPALRLKILKSAWKAVDGVTLDEMKDLTGLSTSTISRAAEDMEIHKIVNYTGSQGKKVIIMLTDDTRKELKTKFKETVETWQT